jgi:hypothetical protein
VPGVREIQKRHPAVRPALDGGQRRVGRQVRAHRRLVRGGGRDVDAGPDQFRVLGQEPGGAFPPVGRVIPAVAQAGQREELVGGAGRLVDFIG